MIVRRLNVRHFGPFHGVKAQFAPGLNVVFGPNEAGKSTLHAALYAAICGVRRAKGAPTIDEKVFVQRHKPWTGEEWRVGVTLDLADGSTIDIEHDLVARTAIAVDELGRQVHAELIHDGAPDASTKLGLNRSSFLVTACVRQAQLALAVDDAKAIQAELQRAAATGQRDHTAAAAIASIKRFHTENVGLDRANATRPLRSAIDSHRTAEQACAKARAEHARVLSLLEESEKASDAALRAERECRCVEAALAEREAEQAEVLAKRIAALAERNPAPPTPVEDDQCEAAVEAALAVWRQVTKPDGLDGPSAQEIAATIESLPSPPSGPTSPPGDVVALVARLEVATVAGGRHEAQRPPGPGDDPAPGISDEEIDELIAGLTTSKPALDPSLPERLERARSALTAAETPSRVPAAAVATLLVIAAALAAFAPVAAVVVAAAALAGGVLVVRRRQAATHRRAVLLGEVQSAEADVRAASRIEADHEAKLESARACARERGLPWEVESLRRIMETRQAHRRLRSDLESWRSQHEDLVREEHEIRDELRARLDALEVASAETLQARMDHLIDACETRRKLEEQASRRPELEAKLQARRAAEEAATKWREARDGLRDAAWSVGFDESDPERLVTGLDAWLVRQRVRRTERNKATEDWAQLQTLLDGRTPSEFEANATRLRARAVESSTGTGDERSFIQQFARRNDLDDLLELARADFTESVAAAADASALARSAAESAPSVPDAEEALVRAEEELRRVRQLDHVLTTTLTFLESAQHRVHRDLAPVLAESVTASLPTVTAGRYVDARVDPSSLSVALQEEGDGEWRDLGGLSHGTREQVYLLLRVALARHLVSVDEAAPLLLDEVTAHADAQRRRALLDLLHALSEHQQVIVFTHDEAVREWAEDVLVRSRDALLDVRDLINSRS